LSGAACGSVENMEFGKPTLYIETTIPTDRLPYDLELQPPGAGYLRRGTGL